MAKGVHAKVEDRVLVKEAELVLANEGGPLVSTTVPMLPN